MAGDGYYYTTNFSGTTWAYSGSASYDDPDYEGYIKVDKGSPDKALFVIFYAVEDKDPMIF